MIMVNADDFGRSRAETDAVAACHDAGRVASATAMVFMRDSERAAEVARDRGIDVGLHLNLSQRFSGGAVTESVRRSHDRIVSFLGAGRYATVVYHPFLRRQFRDVVEAQLEEFARLYGRPPAHVDGHQHQHLCANVVVDRLIPRGRRVRRNFSFWPGEKSALNRMYRRRIDAMLARDHVLVDYFFSLEDCLQKGRLSRAFDLAETATVEIMTHPVNAIEFRYLMSDSFADALRRFGSPAPGARTGTGG
jgi:predicted glycoside hydrolase/deacetylase ChbG (UPF0249 family)